MVLVVNNYWDSSSFAKTAPIAFSPFLSPFLFLRGLSFALSSRGGEKGARSERARIGRRRGP